MMPSRIQQGSGMGRNILNRKSLRIELLLVVFVFVIFACTIGWRCAQDRALTTDRRGRRMEGLV
jgi:hypothetical protein